MDKSSTEYYKSLQPTQLIAERGAELIVVNPGSCNVRIGRGSWKMPAEVPHCIAWYTPGKAPAQRTGSVGEQQVPRSESRADRDHTLVTVEEMLGVRPPDILGEGPCFAASERQVSQMQWTQVKTGEGDSFRRYICGEEALRIPADEPYYLRRPICRGRLNVSHEYPLQQVCDDLYAIWDWVILEKLSLNRKDRRQLSAVLVVPDTFDNREVKEMISVLLKNLEFQSLVVHQESIAATFGNGMPSACVVQLGAQVTSITCIEDGVSICMTHKVLPYGGEDISRCLLWVQQRHKNWPLEATNLSTNSLDFILVEQLKQAHCVAEEGDHVAQAEVTSYTFDEPPAAYNIKLVATNVPPCGLFYPLLFALEERRLSPKTWYYIDHEDMLVDAAETGGSHEPADTGQTKACGAGAHIGLHEAIVECVSSMGRYDLKAKFFATILLVGGAAKTKGLVPFLESKVLNSIPRHEGIDKVEVFPHRVDPCAACWKGGVMLGILDFSRDTWIHRDDWLDGGPRVGSTKKYKDTYSLHAQALWYDAVLE